MRSIIIAMLCILVSLQATAQQDPLYSQYLMNPMILNPAYAGFQKAFVASTSFRKQWAGFEGSPTTFNVTGHTSLLDNKMGLGLLVLQDNVGVDKNSEIQGVYAYHLSFQKGARLSFGLQGGMINYQSDYSDLTIDRGDPKFQNNISEISPTFGAGIIYSSDHWYVGLAMPRMLKTTAGVEEQATQIYTQHTYASIQYMAMLTPRIKLKPFGVARFVKGSDMSFDFGMALNADNSYTVGLFTRNLHTYGLLASVEFGEVFRFGYVFELPTSKSVGTNFTTHEVTLAVRLGLFKFHNLSTVSDF